MTESNSSLHYPYGTYRAAGINEPDRLVISFGSRKVCMRSALPPIIKKLGFFLEDTDRSPVAEMIFHTTDDVDVLIRQLLPIRKALKKEGL